MPNKTDADNAVAELRGNSSGLAATQRNGSSYTMAEEDIQFLAEDSMRGLRLQLEYLKPEIRLSEHGIDHTIVVFGSTRILDPDVASRQLDAAEVALAKSPSDAELQEQVRVARRGKDNARYYDIARELGRIIGKQSLTSASERLYLTTGGGPGIMEAAHRGAHDVGAKSIGLNIVLPAEQLPNPYITPELCFRFHYFALRKLHFLHRARALVVFPGGLGTLDELFETLTLVSTGKIAPLPIMLVGERYWRQAINFELLEEEGMVTAMDRKHFQYCETAAEIWQCIERWYAEKGCLTKTRAV
jgi:uncharacterized protein (TIGR00730 family)